MSSSGVEARLERLVTLLDERQVEFLFTLLLTAFVGILMLQTLEYDEFARIIPLIVGVPTLAFLVVLVLGQLSPRVEDALNRYQVRDVIDVADGIQQLGDEDESADDEPTLFEQRMRFLVISAWVLGLALLFYYVWIAEAVALFLLGYYRLSADQSVVRTVGYTVGMLVFVYLVFDVILEMRLFADSWFAVVLPWL